MELLFAFPFFGPEDALAHCRGRIRTVALHLQLMEGGLHGQQIGQVSCISSSSYLPRIAVRRSF